MTSWIPRGELWGMVPVSRNNSSEQARKHESLHPNSHRYWRRVVPRECSLIRPCFWQKPWALRGGPWPYWGCLELLNSGVQGIQMGLRQYLVPWEVDLLPLAQEAPHGVLGPSLGAQGCCLRYKTIHICEKFENGLYSPLINEPQAVRGLSNTNLIL